MARPSQLRRWTRVAVLAALVAHALHGLTGFGGPRIDWFFVQGVYDALIAVAVLACGLRARREAEGRGAWTWVTLGLGSFLLGELAWSAGLGDARGTSTICNALYLAFFPLVLIGFLRLAGALGGAGRWHGLLDAAGAALTVAAVGSAWLLPVAFSGARRHGSELVVAFAAPALDLTLVAVVVGVAAGQGWRLDRQWALLGGGLALSALGDAIYYLQIAHGGYTEGGVLDSTWPAAMLLVASAASLPAQPRVAPRAPSVLVPLVLGATALAVLVGDHVRTAPTLAIVLACLALLAVLGRTVLAFQENAALLARSRHEALTDGLTGLPNRRALALDLDALARNGTAATLLLYDLDGFKLYNDTFGHPAGDALLVRLSGRLLEAVDGSGSAYRMGGDEFCVLLPGPRRATSCARVELALRERGEGFDVGASFGTAALPEEAGDATTALQIADQRLYASKEDRRASAGAQAGEARLRVLGEREPDLHAHLRDVAQLAVAVSEELGLGREAIAEVRQAAELHDVGKVALPDLILHKPGPLTLEERAFVEQHTLIGERILAAAPSLGTVGRLVRSSHERWDGAGYPDGLAGEEIPIGSRIVTACDAYDAMTSDRPYQAPMAPEAALAELRRCSGGQFDPAVIDAFGRLALSSTAPAGLRRPPTGPPVPAPR